MLNADRHALFHSLLTGRALAGVIVSFLAGVTTLTLVYGRRYEPARYCGAVAVAAIIAGWGLAPWPTVLPGLTVHEAAASHDTLVCVLVGAVILFPSLGVLFRLELTGRFSADESSSPEVSVDGISAVDSSLPARAAIACLIAGVGLLNIADARWAHAVGIVCLLAFVLLAFRALIFSALDEQAISDSQSTP